MVGPQALPMTSGFRVLDIEDLFMISAFLVSRYLNPAIVPAINIGDRNIFMLYSLAGVLAGAVLMLGYQRWKESVYQIRLQEQADKVLDEANREAESLATQLLLEAKEEALQIKTDAEKEAGENRKAQLQREAKLDRREEMLQQQEESLRKQQRGLESSQLRLETQLRGIAEQRQKSATSTARTTTRAGTGQRHVQGRRRETADGIAGT